jgi:CRP/FNR family transcriptional regulator, anaerobic regulatory protein
MKTQQNLIETYFPIIKQCKTEHHKLLHNTSLIKHFKMNEPILHGNQACSGLVAVMSGQLRAFIQSPTGKQITVYRLNEYDVCIMSAACLLRNVTFDIHLNATTDTSVLIIPTATIELINQVNPVFRQYTLDLLTQRFSDVIWIVEQLVFSSLPTRIAHVLLENFNQTNNTLIKITHEDIAKEIGSAREVVSRILKYFEREQIIQLNRNRIEIVNIQQLESISQSTTD